MCNLVLWKVSPPMKQFFEYFWRCGCGYGKNRHTALTLWDFSKAFECMPHDLSLHKFEQYGVRRFTVYLLRNDLNERTQYVEWVNNMWELGKIASGVPQGSLLEPLFFMVLINDLCYFMARIMTIKCGDNTIVSHSKDISF